jgi:hypothetical protein
VADAEFVEDGIVVHVARSKTDQEGQGDEVGIPFGSSPASCPVRALRRWLLGDRVKTGQTRSPQNRPTDGEAGLERSLLATGVG